HDRKNQRCHDKHKPLQIVIFEPSGDVQNDNDDGDEVK
ncbi:MAG: hypothetical protein ACI915_003741, partial [Gammaproteobacteria bacterium]